jgi:hypothetical protein
MKSIHWKSWIAALSVSVYLGSVSLAAAQQTTTSSPQTSPATAESPAKSIDLFAFPKSGQSKEQQLKDETECYAMAKERTGLDPQKPAPTAPTVEQIQAAQKQAADSAKTVKGARVAGAARGTAGGTAIGAIAGNTGKGAAIGAVAGGMKGGAQQRAATTQAKQKAAAQAKAKLEKEQELEMQAHKEGQDTFQRAFSACMDARGYSVK